MPKYKDYVQKMMEDNPEVFDEFKIIHSKYELDPDTNQTEFNRVGRIVQEVIREYENRLCRNTERGMYSKFSASLAEKFQNEVRKVFPKVDDIGIIIQNDKSFEIKKINLKN
ncbi:hypothetical protein JXA63_01340 [Candidatus Woesebacteria bacterium]|nr:hypothetical protein [Candidatus Woesebacteria bacterium]